MKRNVCILGSLVLAASLLAVPVFAQTGNAPGGTIKNVIIMIPDGMSVAGTTLARLVKGSSLALDEQSCGLVSTWSSDGTIADSAPAGSAYSTGWKSQTGYVATLGKDYSLPGVRKPADGETLRPVATILEAARLSGRSTGMISTSEFMHATPADFAAHDGSRSNYDNLTEQIVYNGLNVVLGGGIRYLTPAARKDKEDMLGILRGRGYAYVENTTGFKTATGDKLFGLFGKNASATAMAYDIDRDPEREPSLSEMTAKALEILGKNPKGFFLMVEGSKIDWAAHANDPAGIVSDVLAFDTAVQTALDFAKTDRNTVVVALTDHGNSGISIGDRSISSGYDKTNFSTFVNPIKKARLTGEGLEAVLPSSMSVVKKDAAGKDTSVMTVNPDKVADIRKVMADYYGISDLTDAEVEAIAITRAGSMNYTVGAMLAVRAKIGFTTNGHTGEDVVLYAYDPSGNRPTGLIDNTDVAKYMAMSMGLDLDATTARLFVEAKSAFEKLGATVSEDKTDAENPVLVAVSKDGKNTLRIPRNKSIAFLNGAQVDSDGVTIFNGTKWYVARSLVDLIKK
ncbi:MAG: alkaline phosphatase [Rectinemataceae bacterium]|nr:alkaline phosphatase [Rectinemataceae bacterium]